MTLMFAAIAVLGLVPPAWADMDQKDVVKMQKWISDGKGFDEQEIYPEGQILRLKPSGRDPNVVYMIDFRAHLCFLGSSDHWSPNPPAIVPCKKIKTGYPLLAPLITWDD